MKSCLTYPSKRFRFRQYTSLALSLILIILSSCLSDKKNLYQGKIYMKEGKAPVSACVVINSTDGKRIEIEGEHAHVDYLDKRWCYADSTFGWKSKTNEIQIQIRHGLESKSIDTTLHLTSANRPLEFQLIRWENMKEKGYLSGDTHVHFLSPETGLLQMRAEDLQVLNILTSDFTSDEDNFTGRLDKVSTHDHSVYVGQEIRDWDMGHICLLNLTKIIPPIDHYGGRANPNILLTPRMIEAHRQDAAVTWAHFTNLPGSESPAAIILGHVDAIDLITYNDPTGLPSHTGPWKNSGMDQSEFTIMPGVDLYYQYLNAGISIPLAAGSDKMSEDIPVGCSRLYAPVNESTYDEWIKALKAGTGFITNGPMLTFDCSGYQSGDTEVFENNLPLTIKTTAKSQLKFNTLEIVKNGMVIAAVDAKLSDTDGLYHAEINMPLTLDESSWIAVRAVADQEYNSRILPRGLRVFAHSNPVYFHKNGKPVYKESSVNYLLKYISGVRNWIIPSGNFSTQAEKIEFLNLLSEAEKVLLNTN